ncbi:MAG: sulfatase-like hydrolase/transferase [Blastocatellia bacterium]
MHKSKKGTVTRREFVGSAIAGSILSSNQTFSQSKSNSPPNLLFILADDLGWGDLSCYGRPDYETPNLDRLASEGVRFTNAYSAAPVCTPTRCAFITGRYPARTAVGLEEPITWRKNLAGDRLNTVGLPPEHPTIASLLKRNNYATALVGKWHLGYLPTFGPIQSGFDGFFGIMSGGVDYFTYKDAVGEADLFEDNVPVERIGYLTDLLTERAVGFISRRHTRPFYLSLHYTAPHWPWEGPSDRETSAKLKLGYEGATSGGSVKTYAAMMKSLDDGIGLVMGALKRAKLDRNTLVIFTSDNGGERFSYNWPFSGQKFGLREGGTRVPAIVRWLGTVPAGRVTEQAAITMDWTATLLSAAGAKADPTYPMDGHDLLSIIKGLRPNYDRTFFWRTKRQDAMRSGKWKYFRDGENEYLFDLSVDEREQADFKESHPDMLKNLRSEFLRWQSGVLQYPKTN